VDNQTPVELNDDVVSCKSSVVPMIGALKVPVNKGHKGHKKKLNTKSKVFTRNIGKYDDSRSVSVNSVNIASLTLANFKGKPVSELFLTKELEQREKNAVYYNGESVEEFKNRNLFDDDSDPRNPHLSCKSMKNFERENLPTKEPTKTEQRFSTYAKEYTPSYMNDSPINRETTDIKYDQQSWQEQEVKENSAYKNLFENSCFQLLNEKLTAFTTGRFKRPQYRVSYYMSKTYSQGNITNLTQLICNHSL
jgi:hypothetical protein